jgi:hypothetical protein
MGSITYLERITVTPRRRRILVRLGYQENRTVLADEQARFLDQAIKQALLLCHGKGAFGRFRIARHDAATTTLENGAQFGSALLAKMLRASDEMVLMASTMGAEVTERISAETSRGDATRGVIFDATASQAADAGLDFMMTMLNTVLRKEGKRLTRRRFSPGYGDLSLVHQRIIFDLLGLERLDLQLTKTLMLVPEKSVLAILGIEGIKS